MPAPLGTALADNSPAEQDDQYLLRHARSGDRKALDALL